MRAPRRLTSSNAGRDTAQNVTRFGVDRSAVAWRQPSEPVGLRKPKQLRAQGGGILHEHALRRKRRLGPCLNQRKNAPDHPLCRNALRPDDALRDGRGTRQNLGLDGPARRGRSQRSHAGAAGTTHCLCGRLPRPRRAAATFREEHGSTSLGAAVLADPDRQPQPRPRGPAARSAAP